MPSSIQVRGSRFLVLDGCPLVASNLVRWEDTEHRHRTMIPKTHHMENTLKRDVECHLHHRLRRATPVDDGDEPSCMIFLVRAPRKVVQDLHSLEGSVPTLCSRFHASTTPGATYLDLLQYTQRSQRVCELFHVRVVERGLEAAKGPVVCPEI